MTCIKLRSIALTAVAATLTVASASSRAVTLLSEGFESVASLSSKGWSQSNLSTPAGSTGWFQGNGDPVTGPFAAQAGTANSYLAGNYNGAAPGGRLNEVLTSPLFSTAAAGAVTFWARDETLSPYTDTIRFGLTGGSATTVVLTGTWTKYTADFAAAGAGSTGQFSLSYIGSADASDAIGIDTLSVDTTPGVPVTPPPVAAVPEPATVMLMTGGLLAIGVARRRRR